MSVCLEFETFFLSERVLENAEGRYEIVSRQHNRESLQENLLLQHDKKQPGEFQEWSYQPNARHLYRKQSVYGVVM